MGISARQGLFDLARSPELLAPLTGRKGLFGMMLGMSAALNVLLLSGSLFMLLVYDEVLPSRSTPSLIGLLVLLLIAFGFQAAIDRLRDRIASNTGELFETALSERVFKAVFDAGQGGSARRDAIQPVRDLDQIRSFLGGPGAMALLDLPWVMLFLGVLFAFHFLLGLVSLAGALVLVILTVATDRMTAMHVEAATGNNVERFAFAEACRRNTDTIQALGMMDSSSRRWRVLSEGHAKAHGKVFDRLSAVRSFSKTFRLLLQSLVLACGAWLVIGDKASGGVIIASSILSSRALAPIDLAIGNWRGMVAARQAWNRLAERFENAPVPPTRTALPRPSRSLTVENLAAAAPGNQVILFRDIGFSLAAGEILGIVGPSGSGKSSLARALVGVLPPVRGAVRLDGASITQWDPDVIGAQIGYLPQDIEMFDGTIAQNIARFEIAAPADAIVKAAQDAGIHDLVVHLPDGYDTIIGASGRALSAGQRQRVALARALYRDPFLIVLDEPNSNLDAAGDDALNRAIAGARARGAIVILIAHRPSALTEADKLLWLEAGMVRAFGPKPEILPMLTGSPAKPALAPAIAAA